jgi:flagellar basal body-associated protein FliL
MNEVNGLPIAFFVVAGGIILVLSAWVVMRFGRSIAKALLTMALLVIGLVVALAVMGQSAASYQTATAAKETAEVAKTAATGNLLMVGALGCVGGTSFVVVIGALGIAGYFWFKSRRVEQEQTRVAIPRQQALPQPPQAEPVVYYVSGEQDSVLNGVDLSKYGW